MTARRTASRYLPLQAVVGALALLAVACGSSASSVSAELAADPVIQVAAPAPAPAASTETSHEYGTSIDDWNEGSDASEQEQDAEPAGVDGGSESDESDTPVIAWDDLIPPGFSGNDIVSRYEEQLDSVEAGSAEANALYEEMMAEFDPEAVNLDLDGQTIRLAGFVAPLTYDDELVTEFLLVPTFGACIHVPPPPPNQTVMVSVGEGLTTDEAWGAVWVEGTITIDAATTDLANASYTITNATSGSYSDF